MKEIVETDVREIKRWIDNGEAVIVDVREAEELAMARVPGALHIPMSAFDPNLIPDDPTKKLVFMCAAGIRSYNVGTYLLQHDMIDDAYNMSGGIQAWAGAGYPLEQG